MRRREFITLLCGAAAVWPVAAGAQQTGGVRRIGVLMGSVENDPEDQSWVAEFVQQLQKLSWTEGKNIRIDYRWAGGDASRAASYAAELVNLAPDRNLGVDLTGFTNFEPALAGKWLELLKEIAPHVVRAAFLFHPETAPYAEIY